MADKGSDGARVGCGSERQKEERVAQSCSKRRAALAMVQLGREGGSWNLVGWVVGTSRFELLSAPLDQLLDLLGLD